MKALVLIQSPRLDTYINVFAAICKKYPNVSHIRILYITDDNESIKKRDIREGIVELSKKYPIYESAADVQLTDDKISINNLKDYIKEWDIIDVTGLSKELSLTVAATSISYKHTKVCLINWTKQFKQGEKWIISNDNHEYIDLLSSGDLSLLRKDYLQKKYVNRALSILFIFLIITVFLKQFINFSIPNDIINILGLSISIVGLYLTIVNSKKTN